MTKKIISAFYFITYLLFSPVFGQQAQLDCQLVEQIHVVLHTGAGTEFDRGDIVARLTTRQGGMFSQSEFDEDLKKLSQDFERVEPTVEIIEQKVYVTINIWPKPIIRSIQWKGNCQISTRRLQRELGICPLSVFERQAFTQAFHKLKAYYIRKGFFESQLDYHVYPICNTNEVDIIIEIQEGRSGKIEKIVFINFDECEERELLNEIGTKKYHFIKSFFTQEGTYNEEAIQQDKLIITNYLQNKGYADAQVDIDILESCNKDRIIVQITAHRGERYDFGRLSFEGNTIICNEEIDKLFVALPGEYFSLEKIRDTIERITNAYGRLGYVDTIVDFEPQLVEGAYRYDVHFKIEEGKQYRVGLIRVFGNVITHTPIILHEVLLTPGEVFNIIKLKATEARLSNIGFFKNVNVYVAKNSALDGEYRDVYIEVEEAQTGYFCVALGYSSSEQLFGSVSVTERNFNISGLCDLRREGLMALRGGGEYLQLSAQIGQKSNTYTLSWTKPYFLDTKWAVGFDLSKTDARYVSSKYDLKNLSLNVRAQRTINSFLRVSHHYRLTNSWVDLHEHFFNRDYKKDVNSKTHARIHEDLDRKLEQKGIKGKFPIEIRKKEKVEKPEETTKIAEETSKQKKKELPDPRLAKEARIHGLISAIGSSLIYDSTNHPLKPTRGIRSKMILEYAGLGGDHTFFNVGYYNSYFQAFNNCTLIKYRADFRFIQPVGHTRYATIPLDERLFLGGEFWIRGYRPFRLGPHYKGLDKKVPRGGLSLQFYSIEIDRQITKDFEVFAFLDAGYLSKKKWSFGKPYAAVGYGVRFKLLDSLPEITLGMGYPIKAKDRSRVKRFFISFGGCY
jgi:outer membrane protein insertion porin family